MAWAWTIQTQQVKTPAAPEIPQEPHVEFFDPHSKEWLLDKFETYKILRAGETAHWSKKYQMYVLTRYNDVMFALNNTEIFSSDEGNLIIEDPARFTNPLGSSLNPFHNSIRNVVENAYSKDNIQRIADVFAKRCKEVVKPVDNLNISEIIEDLSATVVAEIINPPFKKDEIAQYIKHIQRHHTRAVRDNTNDTGYNMFVNLLTSMAGTLQVPPKGPGIYKEFITNNPEKIEKLPLFVGSAVAGASSLTGALEILTLDLFRENKLDIILADRSLIPNLINESLRFHTSTGRFSRTVKQQVTLHGVILEPGTRVALCLESANRDPEMFLDPDKFLLGRTTTGQAVLGQEVHTCVALTKNIMQVWVEQLLDLYGKYRVITEDKDLEYAITYSGNDDMIYNLCLSTDK